LAPQYKVWADAYMAEFPDRKVEILAVSEDFTKYQQILVTQRISNTMPDLIFNVDFIANVFAQDDLVIDLAPLLAEGKGGLKADNFVPQFLGQYRPIDAPDKITGLPVSADSTALFWNKTLFDQAGVTEYPNDNWTWEDFVRVAKQIQSQSGGDIYGGTPPAEDGGSISYWGPILLAEGAKIYDPATNTVDVNSPAAIAGWEKILSFYPDGVPPYSTGSGGAWDIGSGKIAMGIASTALVAATRESLKDFEWDVARVPLVNGQHASGGGSYGFSISATSDNVDASWAFLAWFYDPAKGSLVAQTSDGGSIIPPTLNGLEGGAWSEASTPANIKVFAQTAQDARLTVAMPGSTQSVLTEATTLAFQEVLLSGVDIQTAFDKAAATANEALAAEAAR
jgi:multiple sugar transport system substrate-binding protein